MRIVSREKGISLSREAEMAEISELQTTVRTRTDGELVKMVAESSKYTPEAVALAVLLLTG